MSNFEHRSNIGTHPALADGTIGTVNRMDSLIGGRPPVLSRPEATHIPVGSLVTVTIGRNIGDVPMPDWKWKAFQGEVLVALESVSENVFGPFHGQGDWEGVAEESTIFTAIVARPVAPKRFEAELAEMAAGYSQDAIAWSFGPGRLARP